MEEEHKQKEETSLVAVGQLSPVDVDAAVDYWNAYQKLTESILTKDDYQGKGKNRFKKKSAWRKYATAFNISTRVVDEQLRYDEDGRIITAKYTIEAEMPNGRIVPGIGVCSIYDKAHEKDKKDKYGRLTCPGPCNGRPHFNNPEHDVIATAETRAKSRAISDCIGTGEVSAEEMSLVASKQTSTKQKDKETRSKKAETQVKAAEKHREVKKNRSKKKEKPIKQDDGSEIIPPEKEENKKSTPVIPEGKTVTEALNDEKVDKEIKVQIVLQTIEDEIIADEKELTKMNKLKYADNLLKKEIITLDIFRAIKKLV